MALNGNELIEITGVLSSGSVRTPATKSTIPTGQFATLADSTGNTAARPSPISGRRYFDTDLGIPIWGTGAAWVNALGAPA